jgi:hypothetical protein
VKCIAWNFNGSNFVELDRDSDLKKLKFENGDTIPNVRSYFVSDDMDSDSDDDDDDDSDDDDDNSDDDDDIKKKDKKKKIF